MLDRRIFLLSGVLRELNCSNLYTVFMTNNSITMLMFQSKNTKTDLNLNTNPNLNPNTNPYLTPNPNPNHKL